MMHECKKKKREQAEHVVFTHEKLNNEFDSDFHVFLQQKKFCTNKIWMFYDMMCLPQTLWIKCLPVSKSLKGVEVFG